MAPQPNPDELQKRRAQMLDELMRSDGKKLWRQARRFSVNNQDADDAVEDACVAFLRFFAARPGDHAAAWMMTTVKNAALAIVQRNSVRQRRNAAPRDDIDGWWESAIHDPKGSLEDRLESKDWVTGRFNLLAELKPDQRVAVSLFAAGFSYREIGERQGWTQTKVQRSIFEGRVRLRELLSERGDGS
jgi:RNA polymerase sigma factor (sigma-70 family)